MDVLQSLGRGCVDRHRKEAAALPFPIHTRASIAIIDLTYIVVYDSHVYVAVSRSTWRIVHCS